MEELTDRAWAGMKELLDREMPVAPQRKRRPLIWWWTSAAAAVLLLVAASLFLWKTPEGSSTDMLASPDTGAAAEIPANETPHLSEAMETEEIKGESATAAAVMAGPAGEQPSPGGHVETKTGPDPTAVHREPATQTQSWAKEETAGPPDPLRSSAVAVTAISENQEEADYLSPTKEDTADPQQPELEFTFDEIDLAAIPRLALHPLEVPAISFDQAEENNPKKPLLIPLEVQAGLISRESMNANGFFVGMRSGLRLGASGRWSLQSGIGVQAQQHPFEISYAGSTDVLESQVDQGTGSSDPNGGNNSLKADLPTQIAQSGIELHALYVDVPVLLQWQFSRKWALEAGPRLSWRLASRWQFSDQHAMPGFAAGGNGNLSSNTGGYSRQFYFDIASAGGGNQQPVSLVMQDLYAAGSGGISYLLRPGWRLRLQYQHSITNLLDSDLYQNTDRSLRLSLGIRF